VNLCYKNRSEAVWLLIGRHPVMLKGLWERYNAISIHVTTACLAQYGSVAGQLEAEGRSVSYLRCILQSFYRKLRYFYVRWAPCHLVIMKRSFVFSEIWLCSELSLQDACVCVRCSEMICSVVLLQLIVLIVESCLLRQKIIQVGFGIVRQCDCSSVMVECRTSFSVIHSTPSYLEQVVNLLLLHVLRLTQPSVLFWS